ncbi:hypothetical protein RRG08_004722 [Elysia crispata]|uniref:Uncharacterized protein n=1 Tax=Elysia crispata TaxID=231223 RepID=A0AAE1CXS1_9GAST|nr:hypothetical protein RRG08_004722 [Elysia crispata]
MENQFVSPLMCALVRWRTSLCHLRCALQIDGDSIDGKPVCVTCDVRSRLMENQFGVPPRLMENQFHVRSRLMGNQFVSPALCAPH